MAIKPKANGEHTEDVTRVGRHADGGQSQEKYPVNAKVSAKLDPYIAANPDDMQFYRDMVKENPEYAARSLMLKDLDSITARTNLVRDQVTGCWEFYRAQTPEVRSYFDQQLAKVGPYHKDAKVVQLVRNEQAYQNEQALKQAGRRTTETATPRAAAGVGA